MKKERWIEHYSSRQKILLVGEGDFSFSACLARAFHSASNMVATCLHSQEVQVVKHRTSAVHLDELERLGCLILYEVDVNYMNTHPTLRSIKFDVIVFNFPHAGHFSWLCEKDTQLIEMHKELVKGFLGSAKKMLSKKGEIHVTHMDYYPYSEWNLEKIAGKLGLNLKEKVEFSKKDYPGYDNKRGSVSNCNNTFPFKEYCTYTFIFTAQKKGCSKALKIAALELGIIGITTLLSEILSVGPVEQRKVEQKNTDKVEGKNTNKVIMMPTPVFPNEYDEYNREPSCSIM